MNITVDAYGVYISAFILAVFYYMILGFFRSFFR